MHNVSHEVKGDKLIITVDVSNHSLSTAPPSSTGKTKLVATSSGNMTVNGIGPGLTFSLNVSSK